MSMSFGFELENVVVSAECIKSIRQTDIKLDYLYHLIFTYIDCDISSTTSHAHLFRISFQNQLKLSTNTTLNIYFNGLQIV